MLLMLSSLRRVQEELEAVTNSVPVPSWKGTGKLQNHLWNCTSRTWYLEASDMEPAGTCSSMNTVSGWATGAHMTKLSKYGARAHGAGVLRVAGCCSLTEGTDVFGAVRVNVLDGLALEVAHSGGSRGFGSVGDDNGIVAGSRLHNHLQFSGECNMSRAHSRSTSSVNPSPASLSWSRVTMISFPYGKGGCSS